jgi:hypothetical protein
MYIFHCNGMSNLPTYIYIYTLIYTNYYHVHVDNCAVLFWYGRQSIEFRSEL